MMKKILTIGVALAMVLSLGTTVYGAPEEPEPAAYSEIGEPVEEIKAEAPSADEEPSRDKDTGILISEDSHYRAEDSGEGEFTDTANSVEDAEINEANKEADTNVLEENAETKKDTQSDPEKSTAKELDNSEEIVEESSEIPEIPTEESITVEECNEKDTKPQEEELVNIIMCSFPETVKSIKFGYGEKDGNTEDYIWQNPEKEEGKFRVEIPETTLTCLKEPVGIIMYHGNQIDEIDLHDIKEYNIHRNDEKLLSGYWTWVYKTNVIVCMNCMKKFFDWEEFQAHRKANVECALSNYHHEPYYEYEYVEDDYEVTVEPCDIEFKSAKLSKTNFDYTGKEIKPIKYLTVIDECGDVCVYNEDFTVSYKNNINAGTATMTIKGQNEYSNATKKVTFKIRTADISKKAEVAIKYKALKYTGKKRTQSKKTVVTAKIGGKTKILEYKKDYKITYKNNVDVGTATMTITGMGNYTGTINKTFKIIPQATTLSSVASTAKGKLTVKWAKQETQTTGYQVQYATNSGFTSEKAAKDVSGNSTVKKTWSGLKSGKQYWVRIRTYKTVNGKKYYSSWSKAKKVTIR